MCIDCTLSSCTNHRIGTANLSEADTFSSMIERSDKEMCSHNIIIYNSLTVALAVFFALCLPYTWKFNRLGFWLVIIALPIAVGYDIFRMWPGYIKLFRELNSIEE